MMPVISGNWYQILQGLPLTMDDSQPVLEYACHEGNCGLRNILSAARADEKKAAEQSAEKQCQ
jgi:hypothetical protein